MSLIFCTTCNPQYGRAWIFPSLSRLSCRAVALLDPADKRELPPNVERLPYSGDRFYQDGRFLEAMQPKWVAHGDRMHDIEAEWKSGILSDDVVMLADSDAVLQRDLTDGERLMLDNLGDAFCAGPNMFSGQTGKQELEILRLKGGLNASEGGERFMRQLEHAAAMLKLDPADMLQCPVFNWGLAAAKVSTWRRMRSLYAEHVRGIDPQTLFEHATWQQYAICCILHRHKIPVIEMPFSMHSHGHFELTTEHHCWKRQLYYRNELVFMAHFVNGVCY